MQQVKLNFLLVLSVLTLGLGTSALAQTPTITSFTPTSSEVGTTPSINDTNFASSENIVRIGDVEAFIPAESSTLIQVEVPETAQHEPITVAHSYNSSVTMNLSISNTPVVNNITQTICSGESFSVVPTDENGLTTNQYIWSATNNANITGSDAVPSWFWASEHHSRTET